MTARAVLLDIDGVLLVSWEPIPGAVDAVQALRDAGLVIRYLTNTTSRPAASVADGLRAAGFDVNDGELVTASVATAAYLAERHAGQRCMVLDDGPLDDLGDIVLAGDGEPVDVVVIGSGGPSFDWEAMNRAARAVLAGAALVGMHGTGRWMTSEGACVDGGAYVAALERATGAAATVVGKPGPAMFTEALRGAGVDADAAVMVGDDLDADVRGAHAVGMLGVLVRTGKFTPSVLAGGGDPPDVVLDSVADLPAMLGLC